MDRFDEMRTKKVSQVVTKEIIVTPQIVVAITGQTQQFTANEDVVWSIDGNTSASTTISSTGLLSVAQDERSKFITIIATSGNSAGYAQASIRVQYIVTFDPAGGTFEDGSTEPITQAYFAGETINNIPVVEKVDYRLTNWVDESGNVLSENTKVYGNMTYTAEWLTTKVEFVEYIESTGTQYIDTGFKHNQNTRVLIDFEVTTLGAWRNIFGTFGGTKGTNKLMFLGLTNEDDCYAYFGNSKIDSLGVSLRGRHVADFNKNKLKIDNRNYTFTQNTFQSNYNDLLFTASDYDEHTRASICMKLYMCKIYDNETLVRDFRPCKAPNGIYCLYDMITKTYFHNQGTGEFKTPYIPIGDTIIVTREILDQGQFVNVTPTYLTNQVDGSDGFTIVGRANHAWESDESITFPYYLRWDFNVDLTNLNQISFYARKNVDHGSANVCIDGVTVFKKVYHGLPSTYTQYNIDISTYTGAHTVSFVGGYTDKSGSTSSSTSFCNIIFE